MSEEDKLREELADLAAIGVDGGGETEETSDGTANNLAAREHVAKGVDMDGRW
jgi:hypothetical protein